MSHAEGTAKRLVRGTTVTWIRLGITVFAQVVTTPLYLHYWSASTYGMWLLVLAAVGFLQIPGTSYQNYVGFEMMREAAADKRKFSVLVASSVRSGAVYGLIELSMALLIAWLVIPLVVGTDVTQGVREEASRTFFLMAIGSGLVWNWGGMWVRAAAATGNFARGAWWGVADGLVKVAVPLLVVSHGCGMSGAALTLALSLITLHQFTLRDLRKQVRINMIPDPAVDPALAITNFRKSQALSAKSGLEMLRQQGIRLVLGPLMGAAQLAAFASMRTGANAAIQGLSTITGPLMPELMRFLAKRDQQRSEAAIGTVWMVVVGLMAPAFVVIQVVMNDFFHWWTRGKIAFDAPFFATVSSAVLVFAAAQPASAIVRGNNLTSVQFRNSLVAAVVAVAGTFIFGHSYGILGVGFALLISELVSAFGFRKAAKCWMKENEMEWPGKAANTVAVAVFTSAVAMILIASFPSFKFLFLVAYLPVIGIIAVIYVRLLPALAVNRIQTLAAKLPGVRYLLKFGGLRLLADKG